MLKLTQPERSILNIKSEAGLKPTKFQVNLIKSILKILKIKSITNFQLLQLLKILG
jgi:hypothetical protein